MIYKNIEFEVKPISLDRADQVACLKLARPDRANAFNAEMILEITHACTMVADRNDIRAMVIEAQGKNFCAGADLLWMKDSAELALDDNERDARNLQSMFKRLRTLPFVTIALTKGACYGGAVGLVAACDYAISSTTTRFCLSEVKVGIIPAVIWPLLSGKMNAGFLRAKAVSGQVFQSADALNHGLIHQLAASDDALTGELQKVIRDILVCSPDAIRRLKMMVDKSVEDQWEDFDHHYCQTIAEVRASSPAQRGLRAFLNKQTPEWCIEPREDLF
jgi:methylglutaconyl-CoA hydratase